MSYTQADVKRLPSPKIKRLLRERGYTMMDVARRRKRSHSLVSRVIHKLATSEPVWAEITRMLNEKRVNGTNSTKTR